MGQNCGLTGQLLLTSSDLFDKDWTAEAPFKFLSAGNTGANGGASELPERKTLTDGGGGGEQRATTGAKN